MALKKKKSSFNKLLKIIFLVLIIALGYYGYQIYSFMGEIRQPDYDNNADPEIIQPKEKDPEYHRTNILLLGIDARTPNEASRADTIMILSLDEKNGDVSLLSIPRDTRTNIPGRGLDKINHAHAFGGVTLTIETVEEFLDAPIHYYARINFDGFETIIDILGGVTIDVESLVARNRSELNSGPQHLSGSQALLYVRDRSDSDIGRVKRQQKLIKAVAKESISLRTIIRAPKLLDSLGDNLRTNMPVSDMIRVANLFISLDFDSIPQGVIPGKGQYIERISYWIPDTKKTEELLIELGIRQID